MPENRVEEEEMTLQANPFGIYNKDFIAGFRNEALDVLLDKKIFQLFMEYCALKGDVRLKEFFDKIELSILKASLSMFWGNQRNTAKFLGLKYSTLNEKIKKHRFSLRPKAFVEAPPGRAAGSDEPAPSF